MDVIIPADDLLGTGFNHRRQSRDRALTAWILETAQGRPIYMSPYSGKLFENAENLVLSETYLEDAREDDLCFAENADLSSYEGKIRTLTLIRWNREYPADCHLGLDLNAWKLISQEEFPGFSHEKLTVEVYRR